MPLDRRAREALGLFVSAERDRAAVAALRAADGPFETIGFHLQQAVEKELKAILLTVGGTAPRTHDLAALLDLLDASGWPTAAFEDVAALNDFAVALRYRAGSDEDEEALEIGAALAEPVRRAAETALTRAGVPLPGSLPWPEGVDAKKVGRNDLCPCGSGLRFKECHYKGLRSAGVI